MFKLLGRFTASHPWLICSAWVILGALVACLAPSWDQRAQDDDIRFLPARCPSVRGYQLLEQAFPQDVFASRIIFAVERADRPLAEADLGLVDQMVAGLKQLSRAEPDLQIKNVHSHRDPFLGTRLVSYDRHCTLIQVSLGTPYLALQTRASVDRAEQIVRQYLRKSADPPALYTTGPAGVGRDLTAAGGNSLENTTLATIVLVVVILLVVYRSPLLALVPLATIALAAWVSLEILALCTLIPGFVVLNISQIFAIVMLYGAGTDYCLFLVSRYREELSQGHVRSEALVRSVGGVGGALTASAGTVICGLGLMGLAEFAKVRCGGPAIAIGLAVALAASLTLTPALLRILGRWVFWPMGLVRPVQLSIHLRQSPRRGGVWERISHVVVARPLLIGCLALGVLVPLALLGLRVRSSYRATGELAHSSSSVRGLAAIQRHFTAGEVGPITVLLESSTDWDTSRGRRLVEHLSQGFAFLPNVAEVRSLSQPLGNPSSAPGTPHPWVAGAGVAPPEAVPPEVTAGRLRNSPFFQSMWRNVVKGYTDQVNKAARGVYVTRLGPRGEAAAGPTFVTRLDVVLLTDPFDPRSATTLAAIQTWLRDELPRGNWNLGEVRAETYGVTVNARDLAEVTEQDRTRINALVLAGVFLILLVLVRRFGLAAWLLGTVVLSYLATLGATTLLAHYWNGRPLGEVDWRVPFFLFTILVAVGEDYNILLLSRALEERKKHGGVEGTRRALAHTGGTITSCGLIMAGTFATLMLAGLNTLVQIGFALAFGVLLDTFLVRPFLVPAFTVWLWRRERAEEDGEEDLGQTIWAPLTPLDAPARRAG
jgi:RND superfamily putative drug exporter